MICMWTLAHSQIRLSPLIGYEFDRVVLQESYNNVSLYPSLIENSSLTIGGSVGLQVNNRGSIELEYRHSFSKKVDASSRNIIPMRYVSYGKNIVSIRYHLRFAEHFGLGAGMSYTRINKIKAGYDSDYEESLYSHVAQLGIPLRLSYRYDDFFLSVDYNLAFKNIDERPFKPLKSIGLSLGYILSITSGRGVSACPATIQ